MKKKWFYGLFILFFLVSVCACGKTESSSVPEDKSKTEAFTFVYEGKEIPLNGVFSREEYGEEMEYAETPSCAFDGLDKTYRYEHYEITTYPEGEEERILSIYFLDDQVETKEGLRLGDEKDKMMELYGEDGTSHDSFYTYTKGDTQLEILLQDDVVISIEYVYPTE